MVHKLVVPAALALLLSGCNQIALGPEAKINAAIPVAPELMSRKGAALEELASSQRSAFEGEWDRRMKLRALSCAKGFTPSWYATASSIREKLTDSACFQEHDADLAKWIGYRRIGALLTKPALKPIPTTRPNLIAADGPIQGFTFASEAGIALFGGPQDTAQLVDLNTGQPLQRIKKGNGEIGQLSPNGRMIVFGDMSHTHIKVFNTETGEEIVQVPKTREYRFYWLGDGGAIYTQDGQYKAVLVDFATGKETELAFLRGEVRGVFRVPDQKHQFLIGADRSVVKTEISWSNGEATIGILAESPISGRLWSRNHTGQTPDGRFIFNAEQGGMTITSSDTLEHEKIDFGPGSNVDRATATSDPDKILIRTNAHIVPGETYQQSREYLYSISGKTLTRVEKRDWNGIPVFALPLKAVVAASGARLEIIDPVASPEPPMTVDQIASERRLVEVDRRLADADRKLGLTPAPPGVPAPRSYTQLHEPEPAPAPAPSALPARAPGATSANFPAPLANLVADARIEAVGVYQGANGSARPGEQRKPGVVEVKIRRSDKPLVLVLSSYEPVRWMLISEPGARLPAVLLGGHHQSSVVGAGSARIVNVGQKYAYRSATREYNDLDEAVMRMTGRRMQMLQGRYEGSWFSVGGPI